jgi:hypothetical protein
MYCFMGVQGAAKAAAKRTVILVDPFCPFLSGTCG